MRQIILDTETTGLEPASGHRIIEIGCIEMKDRRKTERVLHHFINPEREIEEAASEIHGITGEQLEGEPVFADIADRLIDFIRDSEGDYAQCAVRRGRFIDARAGPPGGRMGEAGGLLQYYRHAGNGKGNAPGPEKQPGCVMPALRDR